MAKKTDNLPRTRRGRDNAQGTAADVEVDVCEQTGKFPLTGPKFVPANPAQKALYAALKNKTFPYVVAEGPAGVGKTFVEVVYALEELAAGRIDRIYVTRPAREVEGEEMGFLPGELSDKFEPYLTPVLEIMKQYVKPGTVKYLRGHGKIEAVPIGFMRGRTFKDCVVIVDEAQNTTPEQMKMIITRLGENAKMVINGDKSQMDISGPSGLSDAIRRLPSTSLLKHIKFGPDDSVRSGFMAKVLAAYEKD